MLVGFRESSEIIAIRHLWFVLAICLSGICGSHDIVADPMSWFASTGCLSNDMAHTALLLIATSGSLLHIDYLRL
jgi:hypothetical protein